MRLRAWLVLDLDDGKPLVHDGRLAIFWYRRVAHLEAKRWGWRAGEYLVVPFNLRWRKPR